jgi:polyhydroxybutyrate depolymerase
MLKPGNHTRSVEIGNRTRTYRAHIPPGYDGARAVPVVLAFHGGGSNVSQMVKFCGLNEKADREGFLIVYPAGTGQLASELTWNAGNCCGYAREQSVDDVAFTRVLLDDLENVASVDRRWVFATGISNGGMMAYLLASELSDRIAAIAPVAGPMGTATCNPTRPVPLIHFHGTADEFAPFGGGKGEKSQSGTDFYSVEHSIRSWVKANGCKEEPAVEELADRARDGTKVTRKTYGRGKDGAEVVLVVIEGGGHTWPGREPTLKILGKSTQNVSANDAMWEFFVRHPMN